MTLIEEFNQEAALEARDILIDLREVAKRENWETDLFIEKSDKRNTQANEDGRMNEKEIRYRVNSLLCLRRELDNRIDAEIEDSIRNKPNPNNKFKDGLIWAIEERCLTLKGGTEND